MLRRDSYSKEYKGNHPRFDFIKDGVVIGRVAIHFRSHRTEIWAFQIKEEFQGVGFGKAMIRDIIKLCRRVGCKTLWLNAFNKNEPAIRCYTGAGFKLSMRSFSISEYTLELE